MFPKSVSGTSGKLPKNKGNDMAEDGINDAILRENLQDVVQHVKNGSDLSFRTDSAYGQSIIWASERIVELEGQKQSPETGSDENRVAFFGLGHGVEIDPIRYGAAVAWGHDYIRRLERDKRDVQELLDQNSELRRENEQLSLENENLSKTVLTLSKSPPLASPESDEEIYERRRRERLLDEVTLICVRKKIETMGDDSDDKLETGFRARDIAEDIWAGINEFDLQL